MAIRKVVDEFVLPNGIRALILDDKYPCGSKHDCILVEGKIFSYTPQHNEKIITVKADYSFEGKTVFFAKKSILNSPIRVDDDGNPVLCEICKIGCLVGNGSRPPYHSYMCDNCGAQVETLPAHIIVE